MSQCWSSKEPTILLRQIALVGREREAFDVCIIRLQEPQDYCRATNVQVQAADLIVDCMKAHGYAYLDCGSNPFLNCLEDRAPQCMSYVRAYRDPSCYQSTSYMKLTSILKAK